MALKLQAALNGNETVLQSESSNTYSGELSAPVLPVKYRNGAREYPLSVVAEDDAGNISRNNSTIISVVNPVHFDFIISDSAGNEISYLDNMEMDLDVGDTNDFEAVVNFWDDKMFSYNNRIYIPETEYGGIIGDREIITKNSEIVLRGYTWRGLLSTKVIIPPKDSTNLILSGEINAVVRMLIGDYFGNLFYVPDEDTQKSVSNYSVDRFTDVASAIYKLLDSISMRLNIRYDQDKKAVELKAVDVLDYSEELEYSQDNKLDFDIRDCRNGVNHLICGGSGQGLEREIIHLYVQNPFS